MFLKLEEDILIDNFGLFFFVWLRITLIKIQSKYNNIIIFSEIKNFGLRKKLLMKIAELKEEKKKKIDDLDECIE